MNNECEYCQPSHKRKFIKLRFFKGFKTDNYLNYSLRIGKSFKWAKFKKHKLMLLDHGEVYAHIDINYCPICGRKLKGDANNGN
ncbi:hypothetical protein EEO52_04685 [Staphylococcus pseudintermedius]|nr:hypothetical protein [Staphylococcus pseudintermedius]EGQ4392846.1 hypothetical protein [Staphylococcus pseudintermedius]EGQ4430606.1 hypothetical protein [Staphylococcus pseudintermedius]MBM0290880.1 hypothetical protein [Staphylococcus pseudintermedius]MBM0318671.1 hypothetical protein [Staphylococcus pseudintermedius]